MASGAHVFGAGTVQWVWGLDPEHDVNDPPRANAYDIRVERDTNGPDPAVRQAMLNIVADMGILPETLQQRWGLVPAYPSTDRESPVSHITTVVDHLDSSPPTISVRARAVDTGGGVVAAIEVSLDGGVRFHPMSRHTDRGEWVYTWGASRSDVMYDDPREFKRANGAVHVVTRAVDDSLNAEQPHGTTASRAAADL
jgi:hypothetical protein